jgi:hypothetical protein
MSILFSFFEVREDCEVDKDDEHFPALRLGRAAGIAEPSSAETEEGSVSSESANLWASQPDSGGEEHDGGGASVPSGSDAPAAPLLVFGDVDGADAEDAGASCGLLETWLEGMIEQDFQALFDEPADEPQLPPVEDALEPEPTGSSCSAQGSDSDSASTSSSSSGATPGSSEVDAPDVPAIELAIDDFSAPAGLLPSRSVICAMEVQWDRKSDGGHGDDAVYHVQALPDGTRARVSKLGAARYFVSNGSVKCDCRVHRATKDDPRRCGMLVYPTGHEDMFDREMTKWFQIGAAMLPEAISR